MIDFELTPQQAQVKEMIHQFAKHVVRPISLQADKDHRIPDEFMLRLANMRGMMSLLRMPKVCQNTSSVKGKPFSSANSRQERRCCSALSMMTPSTSQITLTRM